LAKQEQINWDKEALTDFTLFKDLTPNTLPCNLAGLIRKPCWEVFVQQIAFFPDDQHHSNSQEELVNPEESMGENIKQQKEYRRKKSEDAKKNGKLKLLFPIYYNWAK
jgi:hypothetical protein